MKKNKCTYLTGTQKHAKTSTCKGQNSYKNSELSLTFEKKKGG